MGPLPDGDLYTRYLAVSKDSGGRLFVNLTDRGRLSRYGRWGVLEHITPPGRDTPRFGAIRRFIRQTQPRW
jgi:hypothetical protein